MGAENGQPKPDHLTVQDFPEGAGPPIFPSFLALEATGLILEGRRLAHRIAMAANAASFEEVAPVTNIAVHNGFMPPTRRIDAPIKQPKRQNGNRY